MWYLSLIDRLRHLFSNPRDSELMRWWASDGRKKGDGVLRYPSHAQQWKGFDAKYLEFEEDPRNVKFTLSTNGMNPFGDRTNTHSTWQILLSIYNLPPWLFMKRKYLLLTMIISKPNAPRHCSTFMETQWCYCFRVWMPEREQMRKSG